MHKVIVIGLGAILLTACADQPTARTVKDANGTTVRTNRHFVVASATTPANKDEAMICRGEPVTGSHMPTYVCMTPQEAEDNARNSQAAAMKMQKQMGNASSDPKFGP